MRAWRGDARAFFVAHVDDETNACVLWPYAMTTKGYGSMQLDGKRQDVHVVACTRHHGARPDGLQVRHLCGNRLCFNGRHICWGTGSQNQYDRVAHARGVVMVSR